MCARIYAYSYCVTVLFIFIYLNIYRYIVEIYGHTLVTHRSHIFELCDQFKIRHPRSIWRAA